MVTTTECAEKQSPGDAELLRAYVEQGEQSAFQQLYDRYSRLIYGVCLRRLGGIHDMAEEATQMTFLALAKRSDSLKGRATLQPWLIKTCCFCSSAVQRRAFRYRQHLGTYNDQDEVAQSQERARDAEWSAEWSEACKVVDEEVQALPSRLSDLVVRHYFRGESFESIAEKTGLAAVTLRVMAARGREKLRRRMMRRGVVLSAAALAAGLQSAADACASLAAPGFDAGAGGSGEGLDAVLREMDRAAARAMWWKVGGVAAGLATIGVGTALVVNYLQPVQVSSDATTVWRIESVTGVTTARRGETVLTLKAGDVLCLGDTIVTFSNQETVVVSDDGDRILLREEGEVGLERRTLNTEHRTSKSEEEYQQFRVVKGSIVAQLKRPTCFVSPHAGIETDGADFFLIVANGLTTNGAPWSFSRVDVTEGSANFLPSSISNLRSEIPLVARQTVCAGTDIEGQTIAVKAGKSDCRELSPKHGGVFFREYVELYETKGAAHDVLRFTEGRVLLETNAWQMMDKLTTQGGPKIAKSTLRRTGEPALVIANGTADVARVSFPLGLPSVDAFQVTVQHTLGSSTGPSSHYVLKLVSVWPLPIQTIGQVVMGTDPESRGVSGGVWDSFRIRCIRVGVAPGGRSIYEIDTGRNRVYVQNNTVCNWVYVQDPEKWGLSIKTERMNVVIGAIRIQELRCARGDAGAGGARGL